MFSMTAMKLCKTGKETLGVEFFLVEKNNQSIMMNTYKGDDIQ